MFRILYLTLSYLWLWSLTLGASGTYIFTHAGTITNVVNRAHLVITVDFAAFEYQISTFCSSVAEYRDLMRAKEGKYLLAYTTQRFAYTAVWRCKRLLSEFYNIQSLWANTQTSPPDTSGPKSRPSRQAAILGFGALAILTAFSQIYSTSQMVT